MHLYTEKITCMSTCMYPYVSLCICISVSVNVSVSLSVYMFICLSIYVVYVFIWVLYHIHTLHIGFAFAYGMVSAFAIVFAFVFSTLMSLHWTSQKKIECLWFTYRPMWMPAIRQHQNNIIGLDTKLTILQQITPTVRGHMRTYT
jgi:hypothetical protein